jgi:plasmid stabilization system protein ParE
MPKIRKLIWLEEATQDIARLRNFLEPKNPLAAQKVARCILDGAKLLQKHPEAGSPMDDGRRELFLPFANSAYVLRYCLDGDDLVIIRVWHGREQR